MKATYENHSLTDNDVANFARQSFGAKADNYTDEENHNLIRFLARGMSSKDWNKLLEHFSNTTNTQELHDMAVHLRHTPEHWVPFGHPHINIRVSAPVPIARQAFKHKIGFIESEESRRYISSEPTIYIPDYWRNVAKSVKQGSLDKPHIFNSVFNKEYKEHTDKAIKLYNEFIADGVCPEQARFILPQGTEVNWLWTGSLYAFANFYNQRTDPHAQKEIQILAEQIGDIIAPLYPVSWEALTQGKY